ncbi:hypothetical protein JAAARDRAFT_192126, partial [Jaapia argillacea MUCL 33604]
MASPNEVQFEFYNPSTPARAGSSGSTSHFDPPSTGTASGRKPKQSPSQKLDHIPDAIASVQWSVSTFLQHLLWYEDAQGQAVICDACHSQVVSSLLNGQSKPFFGEIITLAYHNARREKYRTNNPTASGSMFVLGGVLQSIEHAELALCTWAVQLVADLVARESDVMIKLESGLHLRASSKKSSKYLTTWEKVDVFSLRGLQSTAEEKAPVLWYILSAYTDPNPVKKNGVVSVRQYQPKNTVCSSVVGSLTFARSNQASLYPLARGIWYFTVKAHQSIYRVESRIAQSVSYESVRKALAAMVEVKRDDLRDAMHPDSGRHFIVVGDNVQVYAKQRDHRISRKNKMMKGFAGTAVEMQDIDPSAFDVDNFVARQNRLQRKQLTTDASSHASPVTLVPLTTGQRVTLQKIRSLQLAEGMKEAVNEFLDHQMGVNEETLNKRLLVVTGDGKTFDQLLKVKKYLVTHDGDFESLCCVVLLLELWHTKWTDLSRIVQTHWGDGSLNDPSSLARIANEIEAPTPSDLRKVDFYNRAHLVNIALDTNILNCWENHFDCNDLVEYFEHLKNKDKLPSFTTLLIDAQTLARWHATTSAHQRARYPKADHVDNVPLGQPWTPNEPDTVLEDGADSDTDDDMSAWGVGSDDGKEADITLANSTLLIRNGVWWWEMCRAVAVGDTGRVWEILKVWLVTFSGSGNPYYSQYLLELYCNFKWEFSPKLKEAILNNWLVNLHGLPGHFIPLDLMQEHANFWLEDMAQHKGKQFDDPFYRSI